MACNTVPWLKDQYLLLAKSHIEIGHSVWQDEIDKYQKVSKF